MSGLKSFITNVKPKQENKYLTDKEEGLKLITKLISANTENNQIDSLLSELGIMINEEFLALTEKDKCPGSAETYSKLQKSFQDLEDIVNFPELENKFTIAVGGQFSAGKSKFLNSLFNTKKLLPTDTSATTSIPTYILSGKNDSVFALNNFQSKSIIDDDALHSISHAFKEKYNLSFSHILKLIIVERKDFKWKNVSFLDTPGYSKADSVKSRADNTDENIAREHLRVADYLIWLIDIQNGTIPQEDIQFIQTLQFDEPILFVINKADKKTHKQLNNIINVTKKDLQKNGIKFHDVIGYSSMKNIEYPKSKKVLIPFIKMINQKKAGTVIIKRFEAIFEDYLNFHKSEAEFLRVNRKITNDAVLDAYNEEKDVDKFKHLTRKQQKDIKAITNSEKDFAKLHLKIEALIKKIFSELNIKIADGYFAKKRSRNSKAVNTYKFDAMVQINDETQLVALNDFKRIEGEIGASRSWPFPLKKRAEERKSLFSRRNSFSFNKRFSR